MCGTIRAHESGPARPSLSGAVARLAELRGDRPTTAQSNDPLAQGHDCHDSGDRAGVSGKLWQAAREADSCQDSGHRAVLSHGGKAPSDCSRARAGGFSTLAGESGVGDGHPSRGPDRDGSACTEGVSQLRLNPPPKKAARFLKRSPGRVVNTRAHWTAARLVARKPDRRRTELVRRHGGDEVLSSRARQGSPA